ncbi:MAG: polyprenyl synthetase family protein [Erysipelotrichaceae bacterium]
MNKFETYFSHSLHHLVDGELKEAMQYALIAPGKKLRVRLLLHVLDAYGIDSTAGFDLACAIEMIHTYSLVHDDLPAMDNDDYRRGRLTVHKQFNEGLAILCGDALLTEAFAYVAKYRGPYLAEIVSLFAQFAGAQGMVLGQVWDIAAEKTMVDLTTLQQIHLHKTGRLIMLPMMVAAYLANRAEDVATWQEIGGHLGLAFQIQDDILDVTADSATLGKTAGKDQAMEKSTYVSLLGIEEAHKQAALHLQQAIKLLDDVTLQQHDLPTLFSTLVHRSK